MVHAIKLQINGRTTGRDQIYAEILRIITVQDSAVLKIRTYIFIRIYDTGKYRSILLIQRLYLDLGKQFFFTVRITD